MTNEVIQGYARTTCHTLLRRMLRECGIVFHARAWWQRSHGSSRSAGKPRTGRSV